MNWYFMSILVTRSVYIKWCFTFLSICAIKHFFSLQEKQTRQEATYFFFSANKILRKFSLKKKEYNNGQFFLWKWKHFHQVLTIMKKNFYYLLSTCRLRSICLKTFKKTFKITTRNLYFSFPVLKLYKSEH